MEDLDADRILSDYIDRHPAAQMGLNGDPVFNAQMYWFKQTLDLLEPALYREGLRRDAVLRVVNTIVYGVPDPDGSIMRMAEARVDLAEAMAAPVTLHVDAELAKSIRLKESSPVGATLRSTAPEPPVGTRVRDDCGTVWVNDGHRPACWVQPDAEVHDPETWTKIAGNYGPVTVLEWGIEP